MLVPSKPLLALTAEDLMTREVVRVPEEMPLRDAAHLLRQARVSGAPVVDEQGRCVGVLSAADFLRWVEEEGRGGEAGPLPACPYQVKGRLLSGEEAVICTLAEGNCPLQEMRLTTGGRRSAVCLQPGAVLSDWQQVFENLPPSAVRCYMTSEVVTVAPHTPLPEVARTMIDSHIHRVIVVDEERKPVGVVSSTDLLGALVYSGTGT
jgi:CBS domain-containing protein